MAIVYRLMCRVTGKCYVGFTSKSLHARWSDHIQKTNAGRCTYISNAIRKHGAKNFDRDVLYEGDREYCLNVMEPFFIAKFQSNDRQYGYNVTAGGDGTFGWKHSEETKLRLGELRLGQKWTPEIREKMKFRRRSLKRWKVSFADGYSEIVNNLPEYCKSKGWNLNTVRYSIQYNRPMRGGIRIEHGN